MEVTIMKSNEYEAPEIQVISKEPDKKLMDDGTSQGTEIEIGGLHS